MKYDKIEPGDSIMDVEINFSEVVVDRGDYAFYCYFIKRQKGCLIALPFFSYNDKQEGKLEGYLIYHDKDSYAYTKEQLSTLGNTALSQASPGGMAGKLEPLPYKPISEENIEDALATLVEKNTVTDLSKQLYI